MRNLRGGRGQLPPLEKEGIGLLGRKGVCVFSTLEDIMQRELNLNLLCSIRGKPVNPHEDVRGGNALAM